MPPPDPPAAVPLPLTVALYSRSVAPESPLSMAPPCLFAPPAMLPLSVLLTSVATPAFSMPPPFPLDVFPLTKLLVMVIAPRWRLVTPPPSLAAVLPDTVARRIVSVPPSLRIPAPAVLLMTALSASVNVPPLDTPPSRPRWIVSPVISATTRGSTRTTVALLLPSTTVWPAPAPRRVTLLRMSRLVVYVPALTLIVSPS